MAHLVAALIAIFILFCSISNGDAENNLPARLSPNDAARQAAYLDRLQQEAKRTHGEGTPSYYAAIRQGLVRLGSGFQMEARGAGSSVEGLNSDVVEPTLSEDESAQKLDPATIAQIVATLEAAKVGARIVGGSVITTDDFRDAVAIARANGPGCSGVIVHADPASEHGKAYVLTAAHCVCALGLETAVGENTKLYVGTNISTEGAYVALDLDADSGSPFVWRYRGASCSDSNSIITDKDLALVRFKNNKSTSRLRSATVASSNRLRDVLAERMSIYRLVGFGYQRRLNRYGIYELGAIGQKALGLVFRTRDCTGNSAGLPRDCLRDNEVILSDAGTNVDTCAGDSGGPVYVYAAADSSFRLVAITSRSTNPTGQCGPGGMYGLVDTVAVQWIESKLQRSIARQD